MALHRLVSPDDAMEGLKGRNNSEKMGMNSDNEKKLAKRATELGNSADPKAFPGLVELDASESPLERRNFETKMQLQKNI
jgi:hypothetical protein